MDFWKRRNKIMEKLPLGLVGFCIGIFFLLIGFWNEQFTEIYRKAVMICLECIGIG